MITTQSHMSIFRRIVAGTVAATALVIAWLMFAGSTAVAQEIVATSTTAIVVHKDTEIDNLSLSELRNIFLANQQFWPNRTRIILLVRAPKSEERDLILNTIYQMDEAQFRQYWIAKMFRAEVPRGPKIVFSTNMMLELVIAIPGSISFVNADEVTDDVKVVRIDGKLPSDPDYPLK
jgi:ABC-type phosphate transport system substrate-binding protein